MKELLLWLALAHGADAASTSIALHRGAVEANPMLPKTPAANVVAQASLAGVEVIALHSLAHRRPMLARSLAVVAIGVEASAVSVNCNVAWGSRR